MLFPGGREDAEIRRTAPLAFIGRRRWRRWIGAVVTNIGRGMAENAACLRAIRDVYPGLRRWSDRAAMRRVITLICQPDVRRGIVDYAASKGIDVSLTAIDHSVGLAPVDADE